MPDDPIESARKTLEKALVARERADISWIQPPPQKDGWTLTSDALKFIDALVRELRPGHVIEFGAGLSTKVLARACVQMNSPCAITSIDHDPEFGVSDTRSIVESSKNLTLASQIAPLVARDYGGKLLPTYFWDPAKFAAKSPADLVVIDGPPVDLGGREGVLYQVLEFCRPGTLILLDDASRGSERRAAIAWQETLDDAIEVMKLSNFTKGMVAVVVRRTAKSSELWNLKLAHAKQEIESLVPSRSAFVLVDQSNWDGFAGDRRAWPLVKRGEEDWGTPESSDAAMAELRARIGEGATHFVLPWTSVWWTDSYGEFFEKLRAEFKCVAEGDLLLAFDLRR
jgi:predicted O-methyltransferase YrrM